MGFCVTDQAIDCRSIFFDGLRQIELLDPFTDVRIAVVVMRVIVVMQMAVVVRVIVVVRVAVVVRVIVVVQVVVGWFLLSTHQNSHLCAVNPAFLRRYGFYSDFRKSQMIDLLQKRLLVWTDFKQGSHQHVTSSPHIAFQIECFHLFSPPMWFIMLAR